MKRLAVLLSLSVLLGFSTLANAELQPRQGGLVYDTDFGITWTQPNNTFMTWDQANTWAATLGPDWRLPTSLNRDLTGPDAGYNVTGSEMGHLYYTELGNAVGGPLAHTAPFTNLQPSYYWSGTEYALYTSTAWGFYFSDGTQYVVGAKDRTFYALAVHEGDVGAPVPIPGAILLFVPGLVGLAAIRRKIKK
jgi:hypothetical protein